MIKNKVLSGMRPTGNLHLGHYHGVLKNWLNLQNKYDSYFFVADWHALTTHYEDKLNISSQTKNIIIDWLSCGINPNTATIFVQSQVAEHAELNLLLSMITPLSWLERVPSFKDQQKKLQNKDLSTYGFLGYPLLQSADILIYKANLVPVGEDQVSHIELTREIARRFNYIYGREKDAVQKAEQAIKKMAKKQAKLYIKLRKHYQENGDDETLIQAKALINEQQNITIGNKERLLGYLEGIGKTILIEPDALLTKVAKMPGIDGQKMSKSYHNTISLRDDNLTITKKIKTMPTDPARIKLTDKGDPHKCPVWQLHQIYSDNNTLNAVATGCKEAQIGCVECKQPIIDKIIAELTVIQENINIYQQDTKLVDQIIFEGSKKARSIARETIQEVRDVMGINY